MWRSVPALTGTRPPAILRRWPSISGARRVVPARFDASGYLAAVERYRISNSFVVPTMLEQLVTSPALKSCDVSSLRCLISGGAPLPTPVKERVLAKFGPVLTEFYGATETRIITAITPSELAVRDRSVGRPIRDVAIRILDEEGVEVPAGAVGEIFICGPGLFSGYWRDPESTRQTHRGEWFSLGDLGRVDGDGYLYLMDRKQDMIISGGENIFPNDIEECLLRHPRVREAAVIGVPDELWGELVVAFVVAAPGAPPSAEELAVFCGERLPNYMKPRRVEFCDKLPRNEVGKILRRCLREAELAKASASSLPGRQMVRAHFRGRQMGAEKWNLAKQGRQAALRSIGRSPGDWCHSSSSATWWPR